MNVPFVELRSRTTTSAPRSRISQWWLETEGSAIWKVLSSTRPTVVLSTFSSCERPVWPWLRITSLAIVGLRKNDYVQRRIQVKRKALQAKEITRHLLRFASHPLRSISSRNSANNGVESCGPGEAS